MKEEGTKPVGVHYKVRRVAMLLDKSDRWVKQQIGAGNLEGFRAEGEIIVSERSITKYLQERAMVIPSN